MQDHLGVHLVEDDPGLRPMYAEYLQLHGYHVVCSANSVSAIENIKIHRFHFMVTDFNLNCVMDGIDLIEHALNVDPNLKIIMVTTDHNKVFERALAAGAKVCLPKPLILGKLLMALKSHALQ